MHKAFISYRRDDSRDAARSLYFYLEPRLGRNRVFMDVDDIAAGVAFPKVLEDELARAKVVLVLIGPRWLSIADARGQPRLFDPQDFVRMEVRKALEADVAVIPVLLDGAALPLASELPADIAGLAERQIRRVRHDSFAADMNALVADIREALKEDPAVLRRRYARIGAGVLAASLAAAALIWPDVALRPARLVAERVGAEWSSYRSDMANAGLQAEEAAWRTAGESNSIEAYRAYLRLHPLGANAALARSRIDAMEETHKRMLLAQAEVERERMRLAALERTRMEEAARLAALAKAEADAFAVASAAGTRPALEYFLNQHPQGGNAAQARVLLQALTQREQETQIAALERAAEERRRTEAEAVRQSELEVARAAEQERRVEAAAQLAREQEQARAAEAERRLAAERLRVEAERQNDARQMALKQDEDAWRIAEQADAPGAYGAYLRQFPKGAHVDEARQRIASLEREKTSAGDREAFARAQALNTEAAYRDYLARNPQGAMRAEAERIVVARQALARQWQSLRASRSAKALAAFRAQAAGTEFEPSVAARLAEMIESEDRDWGLIRSDATLAQLRGFLARWPEGAHAEGAKERITVLERAEARWLQIQRKGDEAALDEFVGEFGWTEYGAQATAELARLKQKNNDRSGVVYITADDMRELLDGVELRLPRAGYAIRIDSRSNPPYRQRLGADALEKAFKERFLIEGGFRATSLNDVRAPAIEGIGGIVVSRVDRTGSLMLLQMHGPERRMGDIEQKPRRFASLNIIRDRFGLVCAMADWQSTSADVAPKLIVERCEVSKLP